MRTRGATLNASGRPRPSTFPGPLGHNPQRTRGHNPQCILGPNHGAEPPMRTQPSTHPGAQQMPDRKTEGEPTGHQTDPLKHPMARATIADLQTMAGGEAPTHAETQLPTWLEMLPRMKPTTQTNPQKISRQSHPSTQFILWLHFSSPTQSANNAPQMFPTRLQTEEHLTVEQPTPTASATCSDAVAGGVDITAGIKPKQSETHLLTWLEMVFDAPPAAGTKNATGHIANATHHAIRDLVALCSCCAICIHLVACAPNTTANGWAPHKRTIHTRCHNNTNKDENYESRHGPRVRLDPPPRMRTLLEPPLCNQCNCDSNQQKICNNDARVQANNKSCTPLNARKTTCARLWTL